MKEVLLYVVYTYLVTLILRWSWTYRCGIDSISHGFSCSLREHFVSLGLVEGHGVEYFVNEIASESLEVSPCYAIHLHCLISHRQELVGVWFFAMTFMHFQTHPVTYWNVGVENMSQWDAQISQRSFVLSVVKLRGHPV